MVVLDLGHRDEALVLCRNHSRKCVRLQIAIVLFIYFFCLPQTRFDSLIAVVSRALFMDLYNQSKNITVFFCNKVMYSGTGYKWTTFCCRRIQLGTDRVCRGNVVGLMIVYCLLVWPVKANPE